MFLHMSNPKTRFTVTTVLNIQQLDELRETWSKFKPHPNAEFQHYKMVLTTRPNILSPYILIISERGECIGMLIGRIEIIKPKLSVGYFNIPLLPLKTITVVYGGLLGCYSDESAIAIIEAIRSDMSKNNIDHLYFNCVKIDSPIVDILMNKTSFLTKDVSEIPNKHWQTKVKDSLHAFLKEKFDSYEKSKILKPVRIFEKETKEKVEIKVFSDQAPTMCREAELVASKTYHRGIGAGFSNNLGTVLRYENAAKKQQLLSFFLYLNNVPISFWIGTVVDRVLYLEFTGYDPVYEKMQPGRYLFFKMYDYVSENKIADLIDYGLGDAAYKRKFGDICWDEISLRLYAYKFKPFLQKNVISATNRIILLFKTFAIKFDLINLVKKRWRKRVQPKANQ